MNTKKVTEKKEKEILTLYYNGVTNLNDIVNIVGFTLPTISRIIDKSFEDKVNLKSEFLIFNSKMNKL